MKAPSPQADNEPAPRGAILTPLFDRAFLFASLLHAGDARKGSGVPYLSHLMSVAALVLEDGGDEAEAIAALLHDALEDHPDRTSAAEIERLFGPRVVALVLACTDTPEGWSGDKKPEWRPRKQQYIEHVRNTRPASRVSLADKLHNVRSILRDYDELEASGWDRFTGGREDTLWYYRELISAFREAGATGYLIEELERAVRELQRRVSRQVDSAPGRMIVTEPEPSKGKCWTGQGQEQRGKRTGRR